MFTFIQLVVQTIDVGSFYFLRNTLLTNLRIENTIVQDAAAICILDSQPVSSLPLTHIEILDSIDSILIQNNILAPFIGQMAL